MEIITLLQETKRNSLNAYVYKQECLLVSTIIDLYCEVIQSSTKSVSIFPQIKGIIMQLNSIVSMTTHNAWKTIALEWKVDKIMNDIKGYMDQLFTLFQSAEIETPRYEPSDDDMSIDYQCLYVAFSNATIHTDKVLEQLKFIEKYLDSHGIQRPQTKSDKIIKEYFSTISSFELQPKDFKLNDIIGDGTFSTVYKSKQISTGDEVAIKVLKTSQLDKYGIEALKRELYVLTQIRNRYIVEFKGITTTPPFWIVMNYMRNGSLYEQLSNPNGPAANQLTIIAYEIAEGMEYLHQNNIIHRDIKSLNILLDDNMRPRICDFGISRKIDDSMTKNVGTPQYMAPEVILKGEYGSKADVFSFGMLLYEMLKREIPFSNLEPIAACKAIVNNERPALPRMTPHNLASLIKDCWDIDQAKRPTFSEIINRMTDQIIYFPGADVEQVKRFYQKKSTQKSAKEPQNEHEIIEMLNEPRNPLLYQSLKINIIEAERDSISAVFKNTKFIHQMICILPQMIDLQIAVDALIKLLYTPQLKAFFVRNDGYDILIDLILKEKSRDIALELLLHVKEYFLVDHIPRIIQILLEYQLFKVMKDYFAPKRVSFYVEYIPMLLSYERTEDIENLLIEILSCEQVDHDQIACISVQEFIKLKSEDVIENIGPEYSFKVSDVDSIIELIDSEDPEEQDCAISLAHYLPSYLIELIARKPNTVETLLKVEFTPNVAQLLFQICQFYEGSLQVLNAPRYLVENSDSIYGLMLLIPITSFFPDVVFKFDWIFPALNKSIDTNKNFEVPIRIAGLLSHIPEFKKNIRFINSLMYLLDKRTLSSIEYQLMLVILSNMNDDELLQKHIVKLIHLSKNQQEYSIASLVLASHVNLANVPINLINDLASVLESFLKSDPMDPGMQTVCEVVKTDAKFNEMHKVMMQKQFDILLYNILIAQEKIDVAIVVAEAFCCFQREESPCILSYVDYWIRKAKASQLPRFFSLRNTLIQSSGIAELVPQKD